MKVVIDIPEELIIHCKNRNMPVDCEMFANKMVLDIANGTPLPKGHGRLIDADKIVKYWKPDHNRQFDADYFIHTLEVAPTIIEADKEAEHE